MKIRTDFVTNSSSSSFIALGIGDDEIAHFITKILGGKQEALSDYKVGRLEIFNGVTSITTTLDHGRFYVHNQCYKDNRSSREIDADNREARKAYNILPALFVFLPSLSNDQKMHLEKLVKAAAARGGTCAEVYIDETDGFCTRSFDWGDFSLEAANYVPDHFEISNGKLLSYNEDKMQFETLFLSHAIMELSSEVFKGCKFKSIEGSAYMQEPGIFMDCKNLENIDFVGSPYVPQDTFKGCTSLKSVTLPYNIYGIEKGAFAGCKNLESINLPTRLNFIEDGAFEGCDALANKQPELWSKICSFGGSKLEFESGIDSAIKYIRTHGGASFKPDKYDKIGSIVSNKSNYEMWHSIYDPYIDEISSLNHRMKFSVYADPKNSKEILSSVSDVLTELHWKRVQDVSEFTNILVVETDEIYQFDRFVKKQQHIKNGNLDTVNHYGKNLLEKAVEIKQNGGNIIIISLNNLLDLLVKRAFNEDIEAIQREAAQIARKESRDAACEDLILSIVAKSKESGILLTNPEITAIIVESNIPEHRVEEYVSRKYGKSIKDHFETLGVLKTTKTDFYALISLLKQRYENKAKKTDVTSLIADNADLDLAIVSNNAKRFTGLSTRDYLVQEGILINEAPKSVEAATAGVLYKPGEEPERIKKRLDTLFGKLDEAYPDKVIVSLNKDHKKWGETVTELYRQLGYTSSADFLIAYGYKPSDVKGGRPKADHSKTIEELKRRYPNGTTFKTAGELVADNPDIAKQLNTLQKDAQQILGMSFGKWLKQEGLLG